MKCTNHEASLYAVLSIHLRFAAFSFEMLVFIVTSSAYGAAPSSVRFGS